MNKNIILVTADCLRNDHYSPKSLDLPFLNFLSKNSTYYQNCYNLADNTLSSIPQLLTSTYLNFLPFKRNKSHEINSIFHIREPRISIAKSLRDRGYNTYAFQTAPQLVPSFGYDKGFDNYINFNPFLSKSIPFIEDLYKYPFTKAEKINESIISKKFVEPYFLWIHYSDVHDPYISKTFPLPISNFLWHRFHKKRSVKNTNGEILLPKVSKRFISHFKRLYSKQVEYLDSNLYDLFVRKGKFNLSNSNFILTSDHGQSLGEFNQIGHGYDLIPTPQTTNVPLYIMSDRSLAGKIDTKKCTLLDIVPTIADLVKLKKLELYDGQSLIEKDYKEYPLVWSNTLDFNNSKFLIKAIQGDYIYWQDDLNFNVPKIYKIIGNKIESITNNSTKNKFSKIAKDHINYLVGKQKKYIETSVESSINERLDPEVYKALKALRYV